MATQQIFLQPGEQLSLHIIDCLTLANKKCKGDFPKYLRSIEEIFSLSPNPNITKELKQFHAGFLEGDGSINVSVKKKKEAKFGLIIDPEFSVTQHVNGVCHLHTAMNILKAGKLRHKAGSKATLVLTVDNRKTLDEKVIPYWEEYVLPYSSPTKAKRMVSFKNILRLFNDGAHQEKNSLMYDVLPLWDEMRMQKGQSNETFATLKEAQLFIKNYTK